MIRYWLPNLYDEAIPDHDEESVRLPESITRIYGQRCLCNLAEAAPTGVDVNIFSQGTFGRGGGAECYTVYWIASTISVIFRLIIETMMGL